VTTEHKVKFVNDRPSDLWDYPAKNRKKETYLSKT